MNLFDLYISIGEIFFVGNIFRNVLEVNNIVISIHVTTCSEWIQFGV